jgi:RNA polymerase sigma factor (sigma-70 family)
MGTDTDLGGPVATFPVTRCSIIVVAQDPDPVARKQALEALFAAYWKPIYKYIRIKKGKTNEDAKDLTQGFFARALEKGFFERYDPNRARFRTYLRVCVDGFVANEEASAGRTKRGGDREVFSLDFDAAEDEVRDQGFPGCPGPEEFFDQEWVRHLFAGAVEDLRELCRALEKQLHFALFQRYDLEGPESGDKPSYNQLATEFELTATQVTNYLAWARREFRKLVLERLRASTGSDEEFRAETYRILGGQRA